MSLTVDQYLEKIKNWHTETEKLREIALECQLTESIKWGKPCYSYNNKNVAIIQGFKNCCAFMFFKGSLLKDDQQLLKSPGENSHIAKRFEFEDTSTIDALYPTIKAYVFEAIEIEKAGLKVPKPKKKEIEIPEEFQQQLSENTVLDKAFKQLTPGRQRAYLLYFAGAKQSKTRSSRIEKHIPRILEGKGMND